MFFTANVAMLLDLLYLNFGNYCLVRVFCINLGHTPYIVNSELCVYGDYTKFNSHFTIEGRDCILRKTKAFTRKDQNIHGALFNVYGLVKGMKYNGNIFNGDTRPAREITINDLHLEFDPNVDFYNYPDDTDTNGFGICNAEVVTLQDCTVSGAPQTDFAVVSSKIDSPIDGAPVSVNVKNILLEGCTGVHAEITVKSGHLT